MFSIKVCIKSKFNNYRVVIMKGYEEYFMGMNDEEWEYFAADLLYNIGFEILSPPSFGPDGGKDIIVEKDNISYIVSCKHYLLSNKHVGTSDEQSILDRITQHKVKGFIAFYSTGITSSLQERLDKLCENGYPYIVFDKMIISNIIPNMDSRILFKYGPNKNSYYMNVPITEYKPLNCMVCGKDILEDKNISFGLAGIVKNLNQEMEFIYGCKNHFINLILYGWVDIQQVLHLEQVNSWNSYLEELIEGEKLSDDFWKNKNYFDSRINQRIYPSNFGKWL